jgi:hypothetical protein
MSGQLYKRVRSNIRAVDGVERESAIRAYCEMSNAAWVFQVRGPMRLRNGREGKDFVVATATLERDELLALRDAINCFLVGDDLPPSVNEAKEPKDLPLAGEAKETP